MHRSVKCVYGIPSPDLDFKGCSLVIIEDAPEAFFTQVEGAKIYFIGKENEEEQLKAIAWDSVFLPFEMVETPGNRSKSIERMKEIFQKLSYIQLGVHLTASDYQGEGLDILKNVLRQRQDAKKGASLFGAFKGVPALICGGGASLENKGALLEEWKEKALILSGGAGLNALSQQGIKPHFAAGIDPNPSIDRCFGHTVFETSFFYQSRFNADQLSYWQGERLWIEGSGGLPVEEWLFSSSSFDGGWNVATFLTRIAYELGCNPIVLCGVDLGSKSAVKKEEETVELKDEAGAIFYTKKDWIMAAEWLGRFAEDHPERLWINCSEGLKFRGFAAKNLNEIALPPAKDLEGLIHMRVQNASALKQDPQKRAFLRESFHKTSQLCGQLLQVMEKYFPEPPQEKGDYMLLELELEEEIAYQKFLLPVWNVWKYILQREIEPNVPKAYGIDVHRVLFMMRVSDEAKQISN